jgi:hypothetical protein
VLVDDLLQVLLQGRHGVFRGDVAGEGGVELLGEL